MDTELGASWIKGPSLVAIGARHLEDIMVRDLISAGIKLVGKCRLYYWFFQNDNNFRDDAACSLQHLLEKGGKATKGFHASVGSYCHFDAVLLAEEIARKRVETSHFGWGGRYREAGGGVLHSLDFEEVGPFAVCEGDVSEEPPGSLDGEGAAVVHGGSIHLVKDQSVCLTIVKKKWYLWRLQDRGVEVDGREIT